MSSRRSPSVGSFRRIVEFEAHHRLVVALFIAAITWAAAYRFLSLPETLIVAWDAFAATSLILAWLGMFFTDAKTRVSEAHLQDSSRSAICCCVVVAALAGLLGAGVLLGSAKEMANGEAVRHVALAAGTVMSSWLLVHTMMALHYTHVFYCPCEDTTRRGHAMGVLFPAEKEPDFLDFAYFSFVIGMTCQVSDVQVTSQTIRRIVLLHALLSFVFNAVILGFSINLASTLL